MRKGIQKDCTRGKTMNCRDSPYHQFISRIQARYTFLGLATVSWVLLVVGVCKIDLVNLSWLSFNDNGMLAWKTVVYIDLADALQQWWICRKHTRSCILRFPICFSYTTNNTELKKKKNIKHIILKLKPQNNTLLLF